MSLPVIPLFAEKPSHPSVPLGNGPAGARSKGQGWPPAGALRAPFTGVSTLAGWRWSGVGLAVALAILFLWGGTAPTAVMAQGAPAERTVSRHPYAAHVAEASRRYGIPEAWIWAVMRVESNGDVRAVSSVGARGLMQIMPDTWANLRARHRLGTDPFDPRDNIMAGAAYLRQMHDRYDNPTAMLAAYNAGPGRYDEYLSRGRPLPTETRAYLAKLASITGNPNDAQLAAAPPPDPYAWRRAALFAVRPGAGSSAPSAEAEPTAGDRSELASARASVPSDGLFVALSSQSPR